MPERPQRLHWRPHHIGDWRESQAVAGMGYAAQGIYHALLDWQWLSGSLPESEAQVRALVRATDAEWADFAPWLDRCFPVIGPGTRQNVRCEAERAQAMEITEKKSLAGRTGGRGRSKTGTDAQQVNSGRNANATADEQHTDSTCYSGVEAGEQHQPHHLKTHTHSHSQEHSLSSEREVPPLPPHLEIVVADAETEAERAELDRLDRHLSDLKGQRLSLVAREMLVAKSRERRPGWLRDAVALTLERNARNLLDPDEGGGPSRAAPSSFESDFETIQRVVNEVLGAQA